MSCHWCSDWAAAMETIGLIESLDTRQSQERPERASGPLPAAVHHTPQQSPVSTPKFGHQRNLSLDFRSMGIILPPLSATIQPHNGSRHQRNRSLDSVLQKIPESESDGASTSVVAGDGHNLHHHPHHGSVDQASSHHHGHPPLKPCLSLSLDPCANLFVRFKESRRYLISSFLLFLLMGISNHLFLFWSTGLAAFVVKPSR